MTDYPETPTLQMIGLRAAPTIEKSGSDERTAVFYPIRDVVERSNKEVNLVLMKKGILVPVIDPLLYSYFIRTQAQNFINQYYSNSLEKYIESGEERNRFKLNEAQIFNLNNGFTFVENATCYVLGKSLGDLITRLKQNYGGISSEKTRLYGKEAANISQNMLNYRLMQDYFSKQQADSEISFDVYIRFDMPKL
jgi:hypothetical protein